MEHETSQMNTYAVECSCGHDMKVQASDMDEAIARLTSMMDSDGVRDHFARYHKGEPVPGVDEVHAHIANDIMEAVEV